MCLWPTSTESDTEVEHEVLEVPEQPWFLRLLRLTTDLLPRLRVFEGSSKVPQRPFVATVKEPKSKGVSRLQGGGPDDE